MTHDPAGPYFTVGVAFLSAEPDSLSVSSPGDVSSMANCNVILVANCLVRYGAGGPMLTTGWVYGLKVPIGWLMCGKVSQRYRRY